MPHATVWFDGACLGNPGPMGAGAVVDCGGKRKTLAKPLGHGTNNVAEYEAAIAGLSLAIAMGATSATLHGDSQLVLRQLSGQYKVSAQALRALHAQARALIAELGQVKLEWVPRERNAEADALSKAAAEGRAGPQ
ncbi:MAG: ribonuclease HI family protein [Candidatus Thermoplasmatota archaeon]|mgnify:CR=1 FL=1